MWWGKKASASGPASDPSAVLEAQVQDLEARLAEVQGERDALTVEQEDSSSKLMSIAIGLTDIFGVLLRIKDGDLTASVSSNADDELLVELAETLNTTTAGLRDLISEISMLAEETKRSAANVAEAVDGAAGAATQAQCNTADVAQAMDNAAGGVTNIAEHVHRANDVVTSSRESAQTLISRVERARKEMVATGEAIDKLRSKSRDVTQIVGTITEVADQTNLLALNAAIEAARAGDAGRGFAVVADEVRKLADSSRSSAEMISQIIRDIQNDTADIVEKAAAALSETEAMLSLTGELDSGYVDIVGAVSGIGELIEQIAAICEETAAASNEIAAGAKLQTTTMTEMREEAFRLTERAEQLKAAAGRFSVEEGAGELKRAA